jgi:hypothetical protein
MLLVMPVCRKDVHLAVLNLRLVAKLDPAGIGYPLLIVHDREFDPRALAKQAKPLFKSVSTFEYEPCACGAEWPRPQNHAWQSTARYVATLDRCEPWLWWEQDAVPACAGWAKRIDEAHRKGGRAFSGCVTKGGEHTYLAGVAVYPGDVALRAENAILTRGSPWDVVMSVMDRIVPQTADIEPVIKHEYRADGGGKRWTSLADIPKGCALWHRCEDGSLQRLFLGEAQPEPEPAPSRGSLCGTFYDSGDFGDTLYKLPTVKAMGGGRYLMGPHSRGKVFGLREVMDKPRFDMLAPLLRLQPYLRSVELVDGPPVQCVNLNEMRRWHYPPLGHRGASLADRCSLWYLNREGLWKEPWLRVDKPATDVDVVFNRTTRWQGNLNWIAVVAALGGRAVFVGTPGEHKEFVGRYGKVPYRATAGLLEAARVIAGAKLFVGNQSACYAMAEGLKVPRLLEICPAAPDCNYPGPGRYNTLDECLSNFQP